MSASIIPAPGALYASPPIPSDFAGIGIASGVLVTCHAVTHGHDRNIYWVYDTMPSSATAITTPVSRGTCFETRESISTSQQRTGALQSCSTCNRRLHTHMTSAEASAAFAAHAIAFPATHVNIVVPPAPGVSPPPGMAAALGITAPIPAVSVAVASAAALVITANTPSSRPDREDYKVLVTMSNTRSKWTSKTIAHEFMTKLETALRQSPVPATRWIYLIPMMVSEDDRNMQDWIENNITTPNLSWNTAKSAFVAHYERADWMDSQRSKYDNCTQGAQESVQKYTDRFTALMRQLSLTDGDFLNIAHYMKGLRSVIYMKLIDHRSDMRNLPLAAAFAAPNPSWDFVSFRYVADKAISYETELSLRDQQQRPAKHNAHAAADTSTSSISHSPSHKRKGDKNGIGSPRKRTKGDLHCKYHPNSTTHATKDCRNPGPASPFKGSNKPKPSPHTSRFLPPTAVAKGSSDRDLTQITCYGCGQKGHYKPDCPNKDKWSPDFGTNKTGNINNKNIKARAATVSWDSSIREEK